MTHFIRVSYMDKKGKISHEVFNADWYGAFNDLFPAVQKLHPKAFEVAIYRGYGEWSARQQPWAMYYADGSRRSNKRGQWEYAESLLHLDITNKVNKT